jgi:putative endonuclease
LMHRLTACHATVHSHVVELTHGECSAGPLSAEVRPVRATHAHRKALGDFGEHIAARHLASAGLRLLDRNWRCAAGEIDIVAADHATVVVCEVKTRSTFGFGTPLEAITAQKAARLHRLGWLWVRAHDVHCDRLRVDVVAVDRRGGQVVVEHIVGVA